MRFRKTIKLFPGVKINLGKNGISTSIGPRGATVNLKPGRVTRFTGSIPDTGLSQTVAITDKAAAIGDGEALPMVTEQGPPPPVWLSALRITRSVLNIVGMALLGILAGVVAVLFIFGGSKRK